MSDLSLLSAERLVPQGNVKGLVVLLHGYGADGHDLLDLGRAWGENALSSVAFVSPHAPEPCGMTQGLGRQWFELTFRDPHELDRGTAQAAPVLEAFLKAELERYQLTEKQLVLVGFSQGTMMALHVGLRFASPLAGILGFSGSLTHMSRLATQIRSKPPILLVHGTADEVVPVQASQIAAQVLQSLDVPVQLQLRPHLGHGIDGEGVKLGEAFIKTCLFGE